ncbi:amidase signature domain-containing protein [Lasiosphaeria miniovina]|uniref:Amidase signature domain-containing protein n=1 Tax=Lasiosphaeria miniovina TaxID=1954250 RepID=A0AA40DVK1_9PEZI|nr:amidase signature domain-containing protein [Lasiosphaeria miniovina]KAK0717215.1 amidase signature domain-containing protein [Lasiosphaeria miniovina]
MHVVGGVLPSLGWGILTAVQITTAFCKAAAIAHQIALERAKYLDEHFATKKVTIGPLHGLPISLKDQFHVKGVDTTMGYVGWIGSNLGIADPSQAHQVKSHITTDLLSLGADCKTSPPQPPCGGSSGGEGALLTLGGSSLGVATNISGSVCNPAAFNSVFGLKPTPEHLSYRDAANTNPGQNTYRSAVGFLHLAHGAAAGPALDPLCSALAPGSGHRAHPLPPACRGRTDGIMRPHPPIHRGLKMVAEAVKQAGHVVDWTPPAHSRAVAIHLDLTGEPLLQPKAVLRPPSSLLEYQAATLEGLAYEFEYSDYWNSTANEDAENNTGQVVDAVIMPVAPHAAVIPGKFYHTAINVLNYSSTVIPVTKADMHLDAGSGSGLSSSYEPLSPIGKLNWDANDAEKYYGGLVGVQAVARKFEEEKVLAIAGIVAAALRAYDGGRG